MIIVKIDVESIKDYVGKRVFTKIGSKKHQVIFRLSVDEFSLEEGVSLYRRDSNIIMIDYEGTLEGLESFNSSMVGDCYIGYTMPVTGDMTESQFEHLISKLPDFLTPIFKFPEDFTDMGKLCTLSSIHPKIRFCGGYLFRLTGLNIGGVGVDILERRGIAPKKFSHLAIGSGCVYTNMLAKDIELVASKVNISRPKKKVVAKKPNRAEKFSSMLLSGGTVEL